MRLVDDTIDAWFDSLPNGDGLLLLDPEKREAYYAHMERCGIDVREWRRKKKIPTKGIMPKPPR